MIGNVKKWSIDWLYDNYCNDEVALFNPLDSNTGKVITILKKYTKNG